MIKLTITNMPIDTELSEENPTINFVWIGSPRFDKSGHDVLGPETFDANFKKFGERSSQNPMVFWCQEKYKEQYSTYFRTKVITITVKPIEESLVDASKPHAAEVLSHYTELTKEGSPTYNYCHFKAMFFNYLLATEGGYVMDTGMYASPSNPVQCKAYDTMKFPILEPITDPDSIEVWMIYAPKNSEDAGQSLIDYLRIYNRKRIEIEAETAPKIKELRLNCELLLIALDILKPIYQKGVDDNNLEKYSWFCPPIKGSTVPVSECGITKFYTNSHDDERHNLLFCALLAIDEVPLEFLVQHIPADALKQMVNARIFPRDFSPTTFQRITNFMRSVSLTPKRRALYMSLLHHVDNFNLYYLNEDGLSTSLKDVVMSQDLEAIRLLISKGTVLQLVDREFIEGVCNDTILTSMPYEDPWTGEEKYYPYTDAVKEALAPLLSVESQTRPETRDARAFSHVFFPPEVNTLPAAPASPPTHTDGLVTLLPTAIKPG